ncbi:MAG TPA: rRNA pseudouridine synthase [Arenimonas sp.]|nr:rRNA pseudouridine synthase [Arenimonas sp.]
MSSSQFDPPSAATPVRLDKRLAALTGCSRREAEYYIEGGAVTVDGEVIDEPQFMVGQQEVVLAAGAKAVPAQPATLLLHKPAGVEVFGDSGAALGLISPGSRSETDDTGIRLLRRHFARLQPIFPLEPEASGLQVFTQDGRVLRRASEDGARIEQEFVAEVAGKVADDTLDRLCHGNAHAIYRRATAKVSWQSENRLRFAMCGVLPGQIAALCESVGLQVQSLKRLRIGRVGLARMPVAQWRYLPSSERF